MARSNRDILCEEEGRDWREGNGRPSKREQVEIYFSANPNVTNSQAARDLGLSRPTVRKWRPKEL
jgi:hypothetical protein